ncbi:MAG: membrane protein insertase YidC [Bacteroidetes bacterium]|nr:membrane protein insertase YidC [Bacteroidota bacterium]
MNRNNLIGILIIGAIFVAWSIWLTPSKEEQAEKRRINDSIAQVQLEQKLKRDSIALVRAQQAQTQSSEQVTTAITQQESIAADRAKYGVFAGASQGDDEIISVESDVLKLQFTNKGGRILSAELKDFKTYDGQPLILFESDTTVFGMSFFMNNRLLNTQDFYFTASWLGRSFDTNEIKLSGEETAQLSLKLHVDNTDGTVNPNRYIEYLYTIKGDDYMIDYTINFNNVSDVITAGADYLNLEWKADLRKQEKSVDRWSGPTVYYKYLNDDVDYLSETKNDDEQLKERVKWVSFKQHFFSSSLIAKNHFENADIVVEIDEDAEVANPRYLKTMSTVVGVPFNLNPIQSVPMAFYFGPNKYKILKQYDLDLQRQIPLGWSFFLLQWINTGAVIPVFNFLEGFGWNYGIIILVLTILLKIILFPIAYKTYKSQAKMRVLKPEIDELNKKFPKKEDAMKKQQATMALYKKAGVNPMAGCVPMLLQMPILFAMFRFFPSSIELRQQSFLWATDLSSYDSILAWDMHIPILSSVYGNHISLFTLLMTISTVLYTRMNNQMMASNQQMPGMKTMMYMMPIMFLGIFNNYASGLSYYYLLANLITFAQMYFIRASVDEKKILKQIELNKKKPVKKSNFQKRLEEAAKKRGYQQPKK